MLVYPIVTLSPCVDPRQRTQSRARTGNRRRGRQDHATPFVSVVEHISLPEPKRFSLPHSFPARHKSVQDLTQKTYPEQPRHCRRASLQESSVITQHVRRPSLPDASDTSLENASESKIKLENTWTFWYTGFRAHQVGLTQNNYENTLQKIGTFDTVQDFWRYWNNIVNISDFPELATLSLFKEGVKPLWEDPENAEGGKWVCLPMTADGINELLGYLVIQRQCCHE